MGVMPFPYLMQSRAERLIAAGRIVLAGTSLLALRLDPSEPSGYADLAFALVEVYAAYALLIAVLTWRSGRLAPRKALATHIIDLSVFWLLMYLTEGPASPFFPFFVFALACAAVRWGWGGTIWTALAALVAYTSLGVYAAEVTRDPRFELNRSIIRAVHLGLVGVFLGYLAAHERRRRHEIAQLAGWPRTMPGQMAAVVRDSLAYAASTLHAPRMLALWETSGEPWLHLASWSAGKFRWTRESSDAFRPPVSEELAGRHFLCPDAREPGPALLDASSGEPERWSGAAIHPQLRERFAIGPVLALALRGESLAGRLFALDNPAMTADDLVLGEIVAQRLAERLDLLHLVERLQQVAATEAQIRLARDLHDGLLQSLTGVALQLEIVRRLLATQPATARERLQEVQRVISAEQRDLRVFVRQLRPAPAAEAGPSVDLAARLEELCRRLERQWGLRVELGTHGLDLEKTLPASLTRDVYLLLHEALVNAARHAGASSARVTMGIEDDRLCITVADDGVGFRFRGWHDHEALIALNLGPVSLRERIAGLGGTLSIDSSESGAHLSIILPLPPDRGIDAGD